jgi:hypothetical protein
LIRSREPNKKPQYVDPCFCALLRTTRLLHHRRHTSLRRGSRIRVSARKPFQFCEYCRSICASRGSLKNRSKNPQLKNIWSLLRGGESEAIRRSRPKSLCSGRGWRQDATKVAVGSPRTRSTARNIVICNCVKWVKVIVFSCVRAEDILCGNALTALGLVPCTWLLILPTVA